MKALPGDYSILIKLFRAYNRRSSKSESPGELITKALLETRRARGGENLRLLDWLGCVGYG
jgi:hypothetical protein